jgi:hypothetical protein
MTAPNDDEDWLELMSGRGEALVRRLVVTPTPLLPAVARQYTDTNLFALGSPEGGRVPGVDPKRPRISASSAGALQL